MKIVILLLAVAFTGCVATANFTEKQAVIVNQSSGFKIDSYVVTANHVVRDIVFTEIKDRDGNETVGLVIARDVVNDIAIIKVQNPVFHDYDVGAVHLRQNVFSIGNPIGLNFSHLEGKVQSTERKESDGSVLIQIGIDVCYGSSGSAVFDGQGRIVGMIVKAIPGTRFTLMVPIQKVVLLIKKTKQNE